MTPWLKQVLPDHAVDVIVAVQKHKKCHGHYPNLFNPITFSEKMAYRKCFDRRPLLTQFADKYAVRHFVADRLGEHVLPQLYHVTDKPHTIPFDVLPSSFVVKPTHGSGWVSIIKDKFALDRAALIHTCQNWLDQSFYKKFREWQYKNVPPQILVEQYLGDNIPDYKLFVFGGDVAFIQVDTDRFTNHKRTLFDPTWQRLDCALGYPMCGNLSKPPRLTEMINAAQTLCHGIDFVRADFYDTDKLYFGELTVTPEAGLRVFEPISFDKKLGALWKRQ